MPSATYYAQNYAGIISWSLTTVLQITNNVLRMNRHNNMWLHIYNCDWLFTLLQCLNTMKIVGYCILIVNMTMG